MSHLLSFLTASASSANRYAPRGFSFYLFDRNAVLTFVELQQALPHRGDELHLPGDVVERDIIRHSAQQILDDLLVRHS